MTPLLRTPDIDTLTNYPEKVGLHLLAAAAQCARNVIIVQHRDIFEPIIDQCYECAPCTLDLAARQLHRSIDEVIENLLLYDSALRDHCKVQMHQRDLPF